jgi:Fe-S oxidoreductase
MGTDSLLLLLTCALMSVRCRSGVRHPEVIAAALRALLPTKPKKERRLK